MICRCCCDGDHLACQTPNCGCGHSDSPVRPLTTTERHAYLMGEHTDIVKPREDHQ